MFEKIFIPKVYLPIIYICVAIIINGIIGRIIDRILIKKQSKLEKNSYNYKKAETFRTLTKNTIKYLIGIFTILAILTIYGIDVSSVLAGLGIVGIVVGLALQDLAKDIIAGASIILENQYAVGDVVSISGFKGEVIFLGLKTTKIKSYDGQIKIISNRNATDVINYSMADSVAIVDIVVNTDDTNEKIEKILISVCEKLTDTLTNLKGKVTYLGLQDMTNICVKYRIVANTKPMQNFVVEREIRKTVKDEFDKNKIKLHN